MDLILSSFTSPPSKVVSLVPSVTESLLAFGLGMFLVGVTDYCEIPQELEQSLVRVGGTKNPDLSKIMSLNPDLIIANQEENERKSIEELLAADLLVWLTFPRNVETAIQDLRNLARIFRVERSTAAQLDTLERTSEWTRLAQMEHAQARYFCPIWQTENQEWWMTFNEDTYANDILAHCGGLNVFEGRERKYPLAADLGQEESIYLLDRDTRYPRVTVDEVLDTMPEVILLPSEPYHFGEGHLSVFQDLLKGSPAVENNAIYLLDGRLITWHGVRMAQALIELPRYFQ